MKIQIDNHKEGCIWHDGNEKFFIGEEPLGQPYLIAREFIPTGEAWLIFIRAITPEALDLALERWNSQEPKLWRYKLIEEER